MKKNKKACLLVDLDGTLALFEGVRDGHDEKKVGEDKVRESVKEVLNRFFDDYQIIIVTGRRQSCREETMKWLIRHDICFDEVFMRANDDKRHDYSTKTEIYKTHIEPKYTVLFVLEDRTRVVAMWRELGLECWQVAVADY